MRSHKDSRLAKTSLVRVSVGLALNPCRLAQGFHLLGETRDAGVRGLQAASTPIRQVKVEAAWTPRSTVSRDSGGTEHSGILSRRAKAHSPQN